MPPSVGIGENFARRTAVFSCASIGAQTPAWHGQKTKHTEITIDTPATHKAAGLLAGGLLLYCAALGAQAHTPDASRECARQGRADRACAGQAAPARPAAALDGIRPRSAARRECRGLKEAIQDSERAERRNGAGVMESIQQDLLSLRKRYRRLGCRHTPTA